jgi:hypothetical protein
MKFYLSLITLSLLILTGCGEKKPDIDTAPYKTAITAFLKKSHMDLKVTSFQDIKTDPQKAEAVCGLKYINGTGPAVRWKFYFEKDDNDNWQVTDYEQNK